MIKTFTVLAEGEKACKKHTPHGPDITVLTNDIEFRGRVTNETDTTVAVLGKRNKVVRKGRRFIDVLTDTVLHFNKQDIVNLQAGSFTGERLS